MQHQVLSVASALARSTFYGVRQELEALFDRPSVVPVSEQRAANPDEVGIRHHRIELPDGIGI
jgi:hypothetical protein